MNRSDPDKSIQEMNYARQKMNYANQKFKEMKEQFKDSYSHFTESQSTAVQKDAECFKAMSQKVESSYANLSRAIAQVEEAFNDPLIQKLVKAPINQE